MILINLLPPELRRRTTTYNPQALAFAGGLAVCLLMLVFCAWIHIGKLHEAEDLLAKKQEELDSKTALAQVVLDKEAKIVELEERQNKLKDLLARKVYWAHTIDDFVNLLASDFPGFRVRCTDVSIAPGSGGGGGGSRGGEASYSFKAKFQIVGDDKQKAGEYLHSMFRAIAGSAFWKQDGFVGKPEESYTGDRPVFDPVTGKVVDSLNLDFLRSKGGAKPKAGG